MGKSMEVFVGRSIIYKWFMMVFNNMVYPIINLPLYRGWFYKLFMVVLGMVYYWVYHID
jgi:hypothetical protein